MIDDSYNDDAFASSIDVPKTGNTKKSSGFMLQADTESNENQIAPVHDTDNYEGDGFDDDEEDSIKQTAVQFQNSLSKMQQKSDTKKSVVSAQTAQPRVQGKAHNILAAKNKPKPAFTRQAEGGDSDEEGV